MAVTQNSYTGNGSTTNYAFTFPYLKSSEVKAQIDATVTTAFTLANATTVQFNTAPANGAKIKIYRETDTDSLAATFYAGSAIKSEDLNDNFTQNLHTTQEVNARYLSNLGGTMVGDMTMAEDVDIIFEGATDDAYETTLTVADPTADRTITLPNITGTVVTTGDTGTVTATMLAANSVDSSELVDGSVDPSHLASSAVTTAKIAADAVTGAKIADDQINSEHYVDASIDTAHIADNQITTAKIVNDAVTQAKIADDAVGADQLASNSVVSASIVDGTIVAGDIASNAITNAKMADDSVGADELIDSSVNTAALATNAVTLAKMADSSVGTSELVDTSVTNAKLATDAVTNAKVANDAINTAEIVDNAVTTAKIADAELTTLAGMQSATASILAGGTALTATLAEINTVVDGKSVETTISDTDAAYPTSGAVVDYVAAQIAPLGGLEVIANEDSFPTQPASGVVISIADAGGIVVNGSGVSTTARTSGNGSDNVTINGFPSTLHSTTLADSMGLLVSSTGSSNTYTYHKLLGKEDDIKNLSDDINDFNARYRIASSAPSSNNDDGDLYFDTSSKKMKVYNASTSQWDDVASSSSSYIVTLSESFDNNRKSFTMSTAATDAQSTIVSINGVIQKPNAGTSEPSEGFAINGNQLVLSAAPPTDSTYFVVVLGDTVSIGTPSDNTVSSIKIQNLAVITGKIADDAVNQDKIADDAVGAAQLASNAVVNASVDASAAIAGTKISPDFGSQNIVTTGQVQATAQTPAYFKRAVTGTSPVQVLIGNNTRTWALEAHSTKFSINDHTAVNVERLSIDENGKIGIGTTSPLTDAELTLSAASDPALAFQRSGTGKFDAGILVSSGHFHFKGGADSTTVAGLNDLMTIESDGNVGIGTTSPGRLLELNSNTAATFIRIKSSDTGNAGIEFGDQSDTVQAAIYHNSDNNYLIINGYNNSSAIYVDPSKNVHVVDGDLKIATAGHGIDFSATTDATGKDNELLDDYEEGTWTMGMQYYTGSAWASVTFDTAPATTGYYVKIGKIAHVSIYSDVFNVTAPAVGSLARITGLPFANRNTYSVISFTHGSSFTNSAQTGYAEPSSTTVRPNQPGTTTTDTFKDGAVYMMMSGTYEVA